MQHLELLLSYARAASAHPARARALAREAVAQARGKKAGAELLGQACLLEASFSYRLLEYADCYALALEASELLHRCRDFKRSATAVNLCFIVSIETGELIRALECVRRALADARRRGDLRQQARLLMNQSVVYDITREYEAAARCLHESVDLLIKLDDSDNDLFFACVNLAEVHMGQAERLQASGKPDEALALRACASETLPALRADAPPAAINTWISLKARLGDISDARGAAIAYLLRLRHSGHGRRYLAYALLALGEYHVQSGRPDKGIQRLERAISLLRRAENRSHLSETEQRLARLHAAQGDYAKALHWQRLAQKDGLLLHGEQQNLRWRLAALERDAEARRAQHNEQLIHAQRLAVVGRLLSELYHALAQPIMCARDLLARSIGQLDGGGSIGESAAPLRQVLEQIDAASALARQLKMFSYRAAPQSMEVSLCAAVTQAWQGMVAWRRASAEPPRIRGDRAAVAVVDAQRLAVLLSILLIEVDRAQPVGALRVDIEACALRVRLRLRCRLRDGSVAPTRSVGVTLCAEIAQEMGGRLVASAAPRGLLCFELELPAPRAEFGFQDGPGSGF